MTLRDTWAIRKHAMPSHAMRAAHDVKPGSSWDVYGDFAGALIELLMA